MRKLLAILATIATMGATAMTSPAEARGWGWYGGWGWGPGIGYGFAAGALATGAYGPFGYRPAYYGYYGPRYYGYAPVGYNRPYANSGGP